MANSAIFHAATPLYGPAFGRPCQRSALNRTPYGAHEGLWDIPHAPASTATIQNQTHSLRLNTAKLPIATTIIAVLLATRA